MTVPALDTGLLQAARLWIGHHRPYYAAALYRCPIVPTHDVPTFAVDDHWRIYVNPEFANPLSVTRFAAALIHEINHVIRDHSGRGQAHGIVTSPQRRCWNLAGDAELNDDLAADGLDVDRDHWVFPGTFGFPEDLTAEVYYRRLKDRPPQPSSTTSNTSDETTKVRARRRRPSADDLSLPTDTGVCGSGSGGAAFPCELPADDIDHPGVSAREAQMVRVDVAEAVLAHGRNRGNVPGQLVEWAKGVLHPKVDWRRVLAGLVREAVATVSDGGDFTYRRFGRRSSASPGIRLPGLQRPLPQVAVIIDTSGSMRIHDLERALSEVRGILRSSSVADDAVTVLAVDTCVQAVKQVTQVDHVALAGRGGTDMTVGIEAALTLRPRPDIIVVLTDGWTPWPTTRLRVPVIAGLIDQGPDLPAQYRPPDWIRCVVIDD